MVYPVKFDPINDVVAIVAVSVLAVLVVEGVKILFPTRARFHRGQLARWLCSHRPVRPRLRRGEELPELKDLLYLLGDDDGGRPVLQQPTAKLMALLQAVTVTVLDFPDRHRPLYEILTQTNLWNEQEQRPPELWAQIQSVKDDRALAAREALDQLLERKLDALQAAMEYRWSHDNNRATAAVAGLLAAIYFTGSAILLSVTAVIGAVFTAVVLGAVGRSVAERRGAA